MLIFNSIILVGMIGNLLYKSMISQSLNLAKIYLNRNVDMVRPYLLIVLIIFVSLCNSPTDNTEVQQHQIIPSTQKGSLSGSDTVENNDRAIVNRNLNYSFTYNLDNPDDTYILPNDLEEVSGLAYYNDDEMLCIQDEKAIIYTYSLDKKKVVSEYDFGKDGDYEDIALAGQTAYVVRSDGHIFKVENFNAKNIKVTDHKTSLSTKNNTEGLAYDVLSNALFIACKGSPAVEQANPYEGFKAIYQFDLREMKFNKVPNFLVDLDKLDGYRDNNGLKKISLRLAKKLQLIESETNFHPSGIAIHPVNNEIYLISSMGKLLIILDRKGNIMDVQDLHNNIFSQPEGICFSPLGDLFIANEGNGGKATILKFKYQPDQ